MQHAYDYPSYAGLGGYAGYGTGPRYVMGATRTDAQYHARRASQAVVNAQAAIADAQRKVAQGTADASTTQQVMQAATKAQRFAKEAHAAAARGDVATAKLGSVEVPPFFARGL